MNNTNLKLDLATEKKKQDARKRRIAALIFFLLVILTGIFSYIIFSAKQNSLETIQSQNFEEFRTQLGKVVVLPEDEKPTVIQVSDSASLKQQSSILYTQVENDDVLLIYKSKLVIFRPSINKIVNIFPVNN